MGFEILDSVSDEILRGFIEHLGGSMPLRINAAGGSRRARKVLAHLAELELSVSGSALRQFKTSRAR
jgi:hypothetical protein